MRTNYSYREYANQAFRFYARTVGVILPTSSAILPDPVELKAMFSRPLSASDAMKLTACHEALIGFSCIQREVVLSVYREKCAYVDAVKRASEKYGMPKWAVWQLLHKATEKFAKARGLI